MSNKFPVVDNSFPMLVPPFRELVKVLGQCQESGTPFACARQELRASNAILAAFAAGFKLSVRGYDYSDEEAEIISQVYARFDLLSDLMEQLFTAVSENLEQEAVDGVEAIVESLRFVELAIRNLHELEAAKPKYSGVPGIDALLRAGYAVLEGRRDWSILESRLESLRPMIENVVMHEEKPPLLAEHCDAVAELFRICDQEDIDCLEQTLEAVKQTGEALMKERLEEASLEEPVSNLLCPRCGASITPWDKSCPSCHGRLPERLEENYDVGRQVRPLEMPGYVQTLFAVAERLRNGEECWAEFTTAVNELRRRVTITRNQIERIPPVPADAPSDEQETVAASREALENGLARFMQALDIFDSINSATDLNVSILDCGTDAVIAGVEETRQVNVVVQRLLDTRGLS